MTTPSVRAEVIDRRTYRRPLDDKGTLFETKEQAINRAFFDHHKTLWEQMPGTSPNLAELSTLSQLGFDNNISVSGRTRWLGGTDIAQERACCQFNCSFSVAATVYNLVDLFWLELNGCGTGFKPAPGTLQGYPRQLNLETTQSQRGPLEKGPPENTESFVNNEWIIQIGDSAEAWAKSLGKIINSGPLPPEVDTLRIDASNIRGKGARLRGYGWICNGSEPLLSAYSKIHDILNSKSRDLLDEIDILDIVNHMGSVLSTRRSAQMAIMDAHNPRAHEFKNCKKNYIESGNPQRSQSNNDLIFWRKPERKSILSGLLHDNLEGADIGFINGNAATRRCPWFVGFNPCAEIILPNQGFCNLVEVNLPSFGRNFAALERAIEIISRANYRQTCVNLEDGILTKEWHQTNQALRLCGVSLTGIVQSDWLTDYQIHRLRNAAVLAAYSMADELGTPRPKAVTTIKPSGTLSKVFGTTHTEISEGIHKPLGRYIFNYIAFSKNDPLCSILDAAKYQHIPHPLDSTSILFKFPAEYKNIEFSKDKNLYLNLDSAIVQLERYRRWLNLWCDHNVSVTISYDHSEIDAITDWLWNHWNEFVAVSWLQRITPSLKPSDINQPYLPQQVVSQSDFHTYTSSLLKPNWDYSESGIFDIDSGPDCLTGTCPIK